MMRIGDGRTLRICGFVKKEAQSRRIADGLLFHDFGYSIRMNRFVLCLALAVVASLAASDVVEITTSNGSKIKGKVVSTSGDEIIFQSEFGTHRIPASTLSPESRGALGLGRGDNNAAMIAEIARLKARVAELEDENRRLKSMAPTAPISTPAPFHGGGSTGVAQPSRSSSDLRHSVSSTGKRHNSRCRYFGSGRSAGPSEGIACKICGG